MSLRRIGLLWTILIVILVDESVESPLRKTCGAHLTRRVSNICGQYGGYNVYLNGETSRRQKRSIVDECCRNTCTDKDLSQYCRYAVSKEISSVGDPDAEIPEPIYSVAFTTLQESGEKRGHYAEGPYPGLIPIKFGTVSPEFTKQAMSVVFSS